MNTRLLNRVLRFFEEEPKRLDMDDWHEGGNDLQEFFSGDAKDMPPCGTIACIAGAACILTEDAKPAFKEGGKGYYTMPRNGWAETAAKRLELSEEQADRLFRLDNNANALSSTYDSDTAGLHWPKKFAERYRNAATSRGRLSATIARVKHFIAAQGNE